MRFMRFFLFLVLTALASFPPAANAGRIESIAAVVNNSAVSASDVDARTKLTVVSSGLPDTIEIREKIRPQIINALIDEQLMIQEAARLDIKVTPEEIEEGFGRLAGQNNFSAEQFKSILEREKIPVQTLFDQIRAQIAWSRVVQSKLRPQVTVAEKDVDAMLERLESSKGKSQYLVSEIFLPVETPSEEPNVRQLAENLTQQMVQGDVPFPRLATQFSQAASAARGGDLGWVQEGQLAGPLDEMISRMNEGELSKPVRSLTGYHILLLRKKNTLSETTMPNRDDIFNKLGMEQLDRLQRRYLLDLKAAAFIERRV